MSTSTPPGGDPYTGAGSWGYRAPDSEPPDDLLSRRLLQAAGFLAVILIGLVAYSFLSGGEDTALNPIARAAERAQRSSGMRFSIEGSVVPGSGGSTVQITGDGAYNARTDRTTMTMSVEVPGHEPIAMDAIGDAGTMYMRSSLFAAGLPPGKEWIGVGLGLGSTRTELGSSGDPHRLLELLRATSGDVEDLGAEDLRGVPTTGYHGTIDMQRFADMQRSEGNAAGARQIEKADELSEGDTEVTVWVDEQGLLRRTRMLNPIPSIHGRSGGTIAMTVDYFDFGAAPEISPPPPAKVFDMTQLARLELGLADGSTIDLPHPTPNAQPLSASAYRTRANQICATVIDRSRAYNKRTEPAQERLHELSETNRSLALERLPSFYVDYIEPEIAMLRRGVEEVFRLPVPAELQGDADRYRHLTSVQLEIVYASLRSAELGQLQRSQALDHRSSAIGDRVDALAREMGLYECARDLNEGS